MDYDDDKGRRRFMVNHTSTMHVPEIICLDDDDVDDDDDLKIDKNYKMFLDHLIDDNSLGPLFELNSSRPIRYEVDNGDSESRKFDMFSGELNRSEVKNEYPMNNRVSEQRKRKTVEISRASSSLVVKKESILRDNRAAERRKRKILLLAREQDNIQRDKKMSGSKVESLRDAPIFIAQESIQRDNRAAERRKRKISLLAREQDNIQRDTKMSGSKVETSRRAVPLVRAEEDIQRVNRISKIADLKAETSRRAVPFVRAEEVNNVKVNTSGHVPLVRAEEDIHQVKNVKFNTLTHAPLVRHQEGIQKDHKVSEGRKRTETLQRTVPLDRDQKDIQRDNKVPEGRKRWLSELEPETIRSAVPLDRDQEDIQQDNKVPEGRKRRLPELEPETRRSAVPLVRHQEAIQRDKKVKKTDGLYVYTSSGVRLLRKQQVIHNVSQGRKSKFSKLEPETVRKNVPLVRAEEDIQQDNMIAERRKKEIIETKAAGTSKVVPVSETSRIVQLTQRNKGNEEESVAAVDKDYMSYLKWLADSVKDSETKHVANVQNDPSDLDPPVLATPKESTTVPGKELLVNVKVEQEDVEPWSDDSDIIAVSDSPFSDGEDTPFVASKSVVDLEEESKEDGSMFTKELMDVLKKPYNEKELLELSKEASVQKPVTRCRELRKGREKIYATDQMGPSYLQKFSDFEKEYKLVDGVDKAKALKLLRGFFFYLRNCSRDGAFKPWSKDI